MTAQRIKQTIRDRIQHEAALSNPALAGLPVILSGETTSLIPDCIAVYETGSEQVEQNGVIMRGVMEVGLNVELHTVPEESAEYGTTAAEHETIAADLYRVMADLSFLQWAQNRNGLICFDIRANSPILSATDGRRISTIEILFIAAPSTP
jgi:hypothetical protein